MARTPGVEFSARRGRGGGRQHRQRALVCPRDPATPRRPALLAGHGAPARPLRRPGAPMSEATEETPTDDEATDDAPADGEATDDAPGDGEATDGAPGDDADETVVRVTVSRLSLVVSQPPEVIEAVVRDELLRRRESARIQAFVPILTERAA